MSLLRSLQVESHSFKFQLHYHIVNQYSLHSYVFGKALGMADSVNVSTLQPRAIYVSQNIHFRLPVYVGEEIVGDITRFM